MVIGIPTLNHFRDWMDGNPCASFAIIGVHSRTFERSLDATQQLITGHQSWQGIADKDSKQNPRHRSILCIEGGMRLFLSFPEKIVECLVAEIF